MLVRGHQLQTETVKISKYLPHVLCKRLRHSFYTRNFIVTLKQASQQKREEQPEMIRAKPLEDNNHRSEEGVLAGLKKPTTNGVKFNSPKSLTESPTLRPLNDGAISYEAESSIDSSNDEDMDQEEQKKMMEDSYLFMKSKKAKRDQEKQVLIPSEEDFNAAMSFFKQKTSAQLVLNDHSSSPSVTIIKRKYNSDNRCQPEYRHGPGSEKPKSQIIQRHSDPEINDPEISPLYRESLIEDPKPIRNINLEAPLKSRNTDIVLETKTVENKAEPAQKQIDTKQESKIKFFHNYLSYFFLLVIFQKLLSITADTHSKWDVVKNDKELKVYKIKVEFLCFFI